MINMDTNTKYHIKILKQVCLSLSSGTTKRFLPEMFCSDDLIMPLLCMVQLLNYPCLLDGHFDVLYVGLNWCVNI